MSAVLAIAAIGLATALGQDPSSGSYEVKMWRSGLCKALALFLKPRRYVLLPLSRDPLPQQFRFFGH